MAAFNVPFGMMDPRQQMAPGPVGPVPLPSGFHAPPLPSMGGMQAPQQQQGGGMMDKGIGMLGAGLDALGNTGNFNMAGPYNNLGGRPGGYSDVGDLLNNATRGSPTQAFSPSALSAAGVDQGGGDFWSRLAERFKQLPVPSFGGR